MHAHVHALKFLYVHVACRAAAVVLQIVTVRAICAQVYVAVMNDVIMRERYLL